MIQKSPGGNCVTSVSAYGSRQKSVSSAGMKYSSTPSGAMPKYFFHIREHDSFDEDFEGLDLQSVDDAHTEALKAAREMVAELVTHGEPIDGMTFEIVDERGTVIHRLPFRSVIE